ncbi:uncharacterized protein swt1 isoform X1 [Alosa sapidissima]|uniref:uncharacterized protein swt1 isoform X1 n=1 Tax=Alosa sapidissima TaxID=34773 RepID=UPI001C08CA36|nr:uncharacterized protein swt1 isoform X1 [Alosa sapidissima]XP_041913983.1 uncharacterized protein swt1 isoform X1 [Alosa sapidissima]XP_041913984.1 uncharacterized protein swt1 isoform X1 [Alosa sapidissima]XP_041913985.1 uncharacterized protein swt1 isoform X1 [Alosa sapidissima]XP_041913986.1 uncharacterized protein swt1 isoform X1 [Alosa sapidissima]
MSKRKHKKSRHRTPSPKRENEKSANRQQRVASEKIEAGTRDHHGPLSSADRKRKTENRDKILPSPKKSSPERGRELKTPVYRLAISAEKKDSRKREEDIVPKTEHHRSHGERRREKKHPETSHAATAATSTKGRKRTPSSSETSQSRSRSTSSPPKSKASRHHTQGGRTTVSGARASHSTAASPAKSASGDLQEQRRKLVKRRSEEEEPEPPAKTSRSTPTPRRQSEELRKERKKLVERRRSTEEVKAKASSAKQERGVTQGKTWNSSTVASSSSSSSSSSAKLSGSARPDSGSTLPRAPRTSASGTENHASPKPQPPISFRIPKKPSAPPPRENIWEQDDESTEQSDIAPTKPLSTAKAAHVTASFIPRSITKAGRPTTSRALSLTKASPATASFKPLSTAKTGQTTASSKPLSSATPVQATVSFKPLSITKAVKATTPSKPLNTTGAGQATTSPEPPSTPSAGPAAGSVTPVSTTKAGQNAASFKPFSITGSGQDAASPEPLSTPRAAQAVNLTPPTYTPQQHEKENNVPHGFYSGAASFSTPGHSPLQDQAGVENHPSFWSHSPQTVPAPSFILQEDNHDNDQEMQLLEELQQARCEHLLEVNVVESYGELTAMDIDPPEEGTAPTSMLSKELIQQDLLIVLDTNILLSHLDLVKKIRSQGLRSLGFPTVLIPWVVLQELDAMKNGKLTNAVERRATPAVNYIYNCLKNQEPRLWGQSMQLASQALCGLKTENNDDRVLQCCLQYQKLYPKSGLILCTNDKNLCSKAVLSGVRALSKADLLQEVDRLKAGVLSTTPIADLCIACPSWQPAEKDESRSREEAKPKSERTQRAEEEERRRSLAAARELSEAVCVLEDTLKDVLSAILQQEMKEVFGHLWTEIVCLKPPWSLSHVLQCVKKHWIAVFGNIVQRGLQSYISQLNDCLCTNKTVDRERMLQALSVAVELLSGFSSRSDYSGLLPQSLSTLQGLLRRLQPQPSRSPQADDDSVMLEVEEASQEPRVSHQGMWQVFENIWTNLLGHSSDVFTALQFAPSSMETAPSRKSHLSSQDALCELQKLGVAVAQLLQYFERLLSADCSVNDSQSLLTFIETTKIAALEPRFTAQALCDCLSQQEYRQKLFTGGSQLLQLQVDLERCAAAVGQAWS